jgi:hypothetical protein
MSVGFVGVFAAVLLDHLLIFLIGAAISLIALIGWWFPQPTEKRALEEMSTGNREGLPLAIGGPDSNGYWGTWVLLLVLGTALATLLASYFYLGGAPAAVPGPRTVFEWARPALICACFAAVAAPLAWLRRLIRREPRTGGAPLLAATLLMAFAALALVLRALFDSDLQPATNVYGSTVAALLGFQVLVGLVVTAMLLIALLWSVIRPGDVRGHAVVYNAGLAAQFALVSAVLVAFTLYVSPLWW